MSSHPSSHPSSPSPRTWTPGCGRPHPDFVVAQQWLAGNIPSVAVQRRTNGKPEIWRNVEFVNWDPNKFRFRIPDIHYKYYRVYLAGDETQPRLCSADNPAGQAVEEDKAYQAHGKDKVTWLQPWTSNTTRPAPPMISVPVISLVKQALVKQVESEVIENGDLGLSDLVQIPDRRKPVET